MTVIETHCHDGSVLRRLTPLTPEQDALLVILAQLLAQIQLTDLLPTLPGRLSQPPHCYSYQCTPSWPAR